MSRIALFGLATLVFGGCSDDGFELSVANEGPAEGGVGAYLSLRTQGGNPDRPNNDDVL